MTAGARVHSVGRHAAVILAAGSCVFSYSSAAADRSSETTAFRYTIFQRVTWSENKRPGDMTARGALVAIRNEQGASSQYKIWSQGELSTGGAGKKPSAVGPVEMRRDPKTEQVRFVSPGFDLPEAVMNQVVAQVGKGARMDGAWTETIKLNLPAAIFPRELSLRLDAQRVALAPDRPALVVRGALDRFTLPAMVAGGKTQGEATGQYHVVLVFSPERHELYQSGSLFSLTRAGTQVRIGATALAVDERGRPIVPLLDLRKELGISASAPLKARADAVPLAVAQAMKAQQVVATAALTAAERATNPGPLMLVGDALFLDGLAGYAGASPLENWCLNYAEAQGGEGGRLVGKFLYNMGTSGLGEALPATLAFPPLIAPVATAYGMYQLYDSMAQLGGAVIAAKISQSLRPFDWTRTSLAQADKALPTPADAGRATWDGAKPAPRTATTGGGGSSAPGAGRVTPSPGGGAQVPGTTSPGVTAPGGSAPAGGGGMPEPAAWTYEKGTALRQAEDLAGMQIEDIQAPDPGAGVSAETSPTTAQGQPGELAGPGAENPVAPQSHTEVGAPSAETTTETLADSAVEGAGQAGGVAPPSATGYGAVAPQTGTFVAEPAAPPSATDIAHAFNPGEAVPEGGVGITQGAPDTPPPPNPSVSAAPVALAVAGGAVVVAGAVALASGSGGGGLGGYHCSSGYSWCYKVNKCCPTHWISGAGWGAYYIEGHGCYGSAQSAARAAAAGYGFPYPCADERKN